MVAWIDYDMLLAFNGGDFSWDIPISDGEAHLLVPLRLWVVSYDHQTPAPEDFPAIEFGGEMGGEHWDNEAEDNVEEDIRYLRGRVEILCDKSIRWSMLSYTDKSMKEEEWTSEGVQIGGIGSMAGVIGMWTSPEEEEEPPLGPWWQWRVA